MKKKNIWIIIGVVVLVIILAFSFGGGASEPNKIIVNQEDNSIVTEQLDKKSEKKDYSVGNTYEGEDVKITLISCKDVISNNEYIQPKNEYKFIEATFEFENISNEKYTVWSLDCYADKYQMESRMLDFNETNLILESINTGMKIRGKVWFEIPQNAQKVTIEYSDLLDKNNVTFIIK